MFYVLQIMKAGSRLPSLLKYNGALVIYLFNMFKSLLGFLKGFKEQLTSVSLWADLIISRSGSMP